MCATPPAVFLKSFDTLQFFHGLQMCMSNIQTGGSSAKHVKARPTPHGAPSMVLTFQNKAPHPLEPPAVLCLISLSARLWWPGARLPDWTSGCASCNRCWLRWGRVRTFAARGMPSRPSEMSTPQSESTKGSTENKFDPLGPEPKLSDFYVPSSGERDR